MMKQANKNILNVPKLRFPEFENAPAWEEKPLGVVCDILNNLRKPITSNNREKGIYPYYGASGVVDYVKDYIFNEKLLLIGEDGAKWGAFENTAFIAEGKYWVNNHAHVLKAKTINDIFLENYIVMLDVTPFITGAAPPKLTLQSLKSIPIPIPLDIKEQQKIADCLTSLDEIIAAQNQKLNILKAHKKGLMQNLFPANGKTNPKLRFPEFMDAMEWKYSLLGDHCAITTGKLNANAMVDKGRYRFYTCAKNYYLIDKYAFDTEALLVSGNGENVGYIHYYNGKFNAYQRTYILNKFDNDICFIKFILEQNLHRRIKVEKKSGNTPYIVMATLTEMQVKLPSKEEQHKIADCLTSLDNIITAQTKKIDTFKAHKKGLMQQLFPSADEISK